MKPEMKLLKKVDVGLILLVLALCAFGLVAISSATLNHRLGAAAFVRSQVQAIVFGIVAMTVMLVIHYQTLRRLAVPIYVLSNLLLIIVLIAGTGQEEWGASRWIRIGGIGFQPADFVKIGLVLVLAKLADDYRDSLNHPLVLGKIIALMALPLGLILLQPDLGTTLIIVVVIAGVLFAAGLQSKYFLGAAGTGLLILPVVWQFLEEYQKNRLLIFLNPEVDPMGAGYQIIQSQRAIGAGMFRGQGLYQGTQSQYGFLPERHTDFIFSVIAEELGFLGAAFLLILFLGLILRCIVIALNAKDSFGTYLVLGIAFMLAAHVIINIGMTIGILPVTGKPLPFISHGGTFMLTNFMAIGLMLNVNMRRDFINF